ncbi:hypothetical protein LCGC14_1163780 [marine sediment metagenome]|uniref:Glycosyltransferase 2-like domain-containing protein n=1 Tax=marine sediment metagenome TaxID=412755 RepID=A0A0F9LRT6_9ZZZZ
MRVSIVTRARNRLEYTIRCVDAVARSTQEKDYEHIVVNQASSDGTRQWLDWIAQHGGEWFSRVRAIQLEQNLGDWGGMLHGAWQATGEYVVQLDNDVEVPTGWLGALVEVLDGTDYGAVALNVKGSALNPVPIPKTDEFTLGSGNVLELGRREWVTACWMCRAKDFPRQRKWHSCDSFTRKIPGGSCRVLNLWASEIDSSDTESDRSRSLSQTKYPRTPQVWEKL